MSPSEFTLNHFFQPVSVHTKTQPVLPGRMKSPGLKEVRPNLHSPAQRSLCHGNEVHSDCSVAARTHRGGRTRHTGECLAEPARHKSRAKHFFVNGAAEQFE